MTMSILQDDNNNEMKKHTMNTETVSELVNLTQAIDRSIQNANYETAIDAFTCRTSTLKWISKEITSLYTILHILAKL